MSSLPVARWNRQCFICSCKMTPADKFGMGAVQTWRGRLPPRYRKEGQEPFACTSCLESAALWLSGVSNQRATAMMRDARRGRLAV